MESGCLPCLPVVLPACLVRKQRPRLAAELAKRLYSVCADLLARSERQKGELRNELRFGTGVCVSLTAVSLCRKMSYTASL
jgi:hypothetical protein